MSFWRFCLGWFERRKEELDEEIRAHIAMDVRARMERGESQCSTSGTTCWWTVCRLPSR